MRHFIIKLILGLFIFTSCNTSDELTIPVLEKNNGFKTPITESSDNYTITYQFKDEVMVLNDNAAEYIIKVVADTILYLDNAAPKEMIPMVGDVLSSRIQEQLPYGLGNKVLSVSKEDGMYKCVTTVARLDEIFEDLILEANIPITGNIVDGVYDTDGDFHPVENYSKATFALNPITFKLEKGFNEAVKGVGELKIGLTSVIEIDLKKKTHEFSLQVEGGFLAGIEATLFEKKNIKDAIVEVPELFQTVLTIGPLILRPHVNFEMGLIAGLEGTIKMNFTKPFGIKVGVKDGKFFKDNLLSDTEDDVISELSWDAKGYAGIYSELAFGLGLYTTNLSVYLAPTVYALGNASLSMSDLDIFQVSPSLGFDITMDFSGSILLKFMGKEYWNQQETFLSYPLYEKSWPLLPSLVPNSTKITEDKNEKHLTFIAEYDYTGGLLSHFMDIHPIFRVYDDLDEAKCYNTDKVLSPDKESQHFTFKVDGLQYDKDYIGKPGIQLMGVMFDNKGVSFRAESPKSDDEGNDGNSDNNDGTGTGGDSGNNEGGGGAPQEGCEGCAAGHCHVHNYFKKDN